MAELIDRKALEEKLKAFYGVQDGKILSSDAIAALFAIDEAEAADAEPVRHGKWLHKSTYYEADECNCSECRQLLTTHIGERMKYCPNCGAKMALEV